MEQQTARRPFLSILIIYLLCYLFRFAEYFFIRTDQSMFGEAFLHKLIGIAVLLLALRYFALKWPQIGFVRKNAVKNALYGLLLGAVVYLIAYGTEYILQSAAGNSPSLQMYVTAYSVNGNMGNQTALVFFLICILGNCINVVMEEGIFRGLFVRLAEGKHSFFVALLVSSVLFGLWHVIGSIRSFADGNMSGMGAFLYALMLLGTSAITGAKFVLLTKITGSLWMPIADHFVNNTIVNILHVATASGADELQVMRIAIAQSVSFVIVLILYLCTKAGKKETFRA